jgi:hypothetical protein
VPWGKKQQGIANPVVNLTHGSAVNVVRLPDFMFFETR